MKKKINAVFLGFAIATVICLMLIGVAIAERSLIGLVFAVISTIFVMGFGFVIKKKWRESGKL